MHIDNLHLENFKKFDKLDLTFHRQFTLLVGNNGSGKTTILDALAIMLGIWHAEIPDTMLVNSRRTIRMNEVHLVPTQEGDRLQFREQRPVVVKATGAIAGQKAIWERRLADGAQRVSKEGIEQVKAILGRIHRADQAGERPICPVVAYYGAGRAWLPSNARHSSGGSDTGPARRWAALYDSLGERIRLDDLRNWFERETIEAGNRGGRFRPGFEVVKRAVVACIPEARAVFYSADRKQIVLDIAGNQQPFDNLSAGQQMMLALIADIAIRVVTQNAFLVPPDDLGPPDVLPQVLKETPGVVLIDELDVHLHPRWQRQVATDLKRIFPQVQFICTSHSPQVIGEVLPEEIRVLDHLDFPIPDQSFGMDANWILEVLMQAQRRDVRVTAEIDMLFKLIAAKDLEKAEQCLLRLREQTGNSEDLARANATIRRMRLLGK